MRIAVIGSGYVGLVTSACLASLGHRVTCVERVTERVDAINNGSVPFHEPQLSQLVREFVSSDGLRATVSLSEAVADAEISIIAVGTPSVEEGIDLSQIAVAAEEIGKALRGTAQYHVVVVKSTVVPGTTDGLVRGTLERNSGKTVGVEIGLCMNPETLREGSAVEDFMSPDRIIIGQFDERSGSTIAKLYEKFDCPKMVMSLRNAEFTKYAANLLLATMVSYSNEIAAMCEATPGSDIDSILDGVHLDRRLSPIVDGKRISPGILSYIRAGAGFGGSCLPKDVNALRVFARERDVRTPLLDAVISVNRSRPDYLVSLAERIVGPLAERSLAVLGLAFKAGTDDLRDSPSLPLIKGLMAAGAKIRVYDPMCMSGARGILGDSVVYSHSAQESVQGCEAAIIATAWREFLDVDWRTAAKKMVRPIIIDARNALRSLHIPPEITYVGIGSCYQ